MKRLFALLLFAFASFAQEAPPPEDEFTKAAFFGKKFADLGEYASAYEQFARADALKPDQPAILYNMAVVLAKAGRYSESQVKADRYNQLYPAGAEKPLIGKLQLELEFQRELQKKRQADQDYADLFNRARFLYTRGELAEAAKQFVEAERLRPTDPAPVYNQGVIHEKQGDFPKAIERYRRWAELENDPERRASIDQRVFQLEHELENMRTKIVCSFCGHLLPAGATWCERCWHGPYLVSSPLWSSRPCVDGASATRTTYFSDERFNKNDILPCLTAGGTMRETLRYTPARQRSIQDARKAEGWTYVNGFLGAQGNAVRFVQGRDYLEKITSPSGGEILTYVAHAGGEGIWLLDREDLIVDAQRYVNRYEYDGSGRIARQLVDYQNTASCNHLISMKADYAYQPDGALAGATISGGYDGYVAEGAPKTQWTATIGYSYDEQGRVAKEELAVTSFEKTYQQKPHGALRDEVGKLYTTMRVKKPVENVGRVGDICATSGSLLLSNPIDLRPFYTLSPNLAVALQAGVAKATVSFTYPPSYAVK